MSDMITDYFPPAVANQEHVIGQQQGAQSTAASAAPTQREETEMRPEIKARLVNLLPVYGSQWRAISKSRRRQEQVRDEETNATIVSTITPISTSTTVNNQEDVSSSSSILEAIHTGKHITVAVVPRQRENGHRPQNGDFPCMFGETCSCNRVHVEEEDQEVTFVLDNGDDEQPLSTSQSAKEPGGDDETVIEKAEPEAAVIFHAPRLDEDDEGPTGIQPQHRGEVSLMMQDCIYKSTPGRLDEEIASNIDDGNENYPCRTTDNNDADEYSDDDEVEGLPAFAIQKEEGNDGDANNCRRDEMHTDNVVEDDDYDFGGDAVSSSDTSSSGGSILELDTSRVVGLSQIALDMFGDDNPVGKDDNDSLLVCDDHDKYGIGRILFDSDAEELKEDEDTESAENLLANSDDDCDGSSSNSSGSSVLQLDTSRVLGLSIIAGDDDEETTSLLSDRDLDVGRNLFDGNQEEVENHVRPNLSTEDKQETGTRVQEEDRQDTTQGLFPISSNAHDNGLKEKDENSDVIPSLQPSQKSVSWYTSPNSIGSCTSSATLQTIVTRKEKKIDPRCSEPSVDTNPEEMLSHLKCDVMVHYRQHQQDGGDSENGNLSTKGNESRFSLSSSSFVSSSKGDAAVLQECSTFDHEMNSIGLVAKMEDPQISAKDQNPNRHNYFAKEKYSRLSSSSASRFAESHSEGSSTVLQVSRTHYEQPSSATINENLREIDDPHSKDDGDQIFNDENRNDNGYWETKGDVMLSPSSISHSEASATVVQDRAGLDESPISDGRMSSTSHQKEDHNVDGNHHGEAAYEKNSEIEENDVHHSADDHEPLLSLDDDSSTTVVLDRHRSNDWRNHQQDEDPNDNQVDYDAEADSDDEDEGSVDTVIGLSCTLRTENEPSSRTRRHRNQRSSTGHTDHGEVLEELTPLADKSHGGNLEEVDSDGTEETESSGGTVINLMKDLTLKGEKNVSGGKGTPTKGESTPRPTHKTTVSVTGNESSTMDLASSEDDTWEPTKNPSCKRQARPQSCISPLEDEESGDHEAQSMTIDLTDTPSPRSSRTTPLPNRTPIKWPTIYQDDNNNEDFEWRGSEDDKEDDELKTEQANDTLQGQSVIGLSDEEPYGDDWLVDDTEGEIYTPGYTKVSTSRSKSPRPMTLIAFRRNRESVTKRAFHEFNMAAFGGALEGVEVVWTNKLQTTAGRARLKRRTILATGAVERSSIIELSTKVLDEPSRLRLTLLHEMCHAAAWLVDGVSKPPHGKCFRKWAKRATNATALAVTTTHDYVIRYKYAWVCQSKGCGAILQRQSRSIDPERHVCGRCKGKLMEIEPPSKSNGASAPTPRKPRALSKYNLFVKEQSKAVRERLALTNGGQSVSQAEVMAECGRLWKEQKENIAYSE